MIVTIVHEPQSGNWQVWAQLEVGDPTDLVESFIIGMGTTRDEAVADAVGELDAVLQVLQAPPGLVPEYENVAR